MSQSRPAAPEPTEIAGRYQVVQKLGRGAFGTVYKAKDRILKRMVAIKTIHLEGLAAANTSLDELLERFRREAELAAQLKHPNIVTIYDIGETEGLSYLAMEFIDGIGLDRVIVESGRLSVERTASIGAQVADALDFAHRNSVVHRDIKPANIMIEPGDRVKVTDFGIAKPIDSAEHLTMTGSLLGTPSYMSPEQAKGASDLDGRSDLFAVGCVLYEMLAGQKAFRGESITALIFKIITEEPPPIRELATDVPEAMVRIITRALAKNQEARYQTGRELADDLLALTRSGAMPTVRQAEVATTAIPAGSLPPPAASGPAATLQGKAPTVVGAPTSRLEAPPVASPRRAAPSPAPSPPLRPLVSPPARRSGAGIGLLIGLAALGLLVVGLAAGGGWYFFLRKPPETVTAENVGEAPHAAVGEAAPGSNPPQSVAPSAPAAIPSPLAPPPTGAADIHPAGPPASGSTRAVAPPVAPPFASAAPPARPTSDAGPAPSFLDEEPPPQPDGRQAGEQLAGKYRSGQAGSTSPPYGATARFRTRPRSPERIAPLERPAVATIRHLINAQEAFHRRNGRYGTLVELAQAQTLFLDVSHDGSGFQRAGYRFELSLGGDGFNVVATPLRPGPRPFHGDDSGYVLAGNE